MRASVFRHCHGVHGAEDTIPISRWIRNMFLKSTAITTISVSLVGLAIVATIVSLFAVRSNQAQLEVARNLMAETTSRAAMVLRGAFSGYTQAVEVLASVTAGAMQQPRLPSEEERAKYSFVDCGEGVTAFFGKKGALTWNDSDVWLGQVEAAPCANAAVCNRTFSDAEMEQYVWRSGALTGLLKATFDSLQPATAQSYVNYENNMNRIYPPRELATGKTYDELLGCYVNVTSFNFYYLGAENPGKGTWTGAYVDPAGQGWTISAVAAAQDSTGHIWGVAGLDLLLGSLIQELESIEIDWEGYIVVIDTDGVIVGLPPAGNDDWGITELGAFNYTAWSQTNTFKSDDFNVFKRDDCRRSGLARLLTEHRDKGRAQLHFGDEQKDVAWERLENDPGWTVLVMASSHSVREQQRQNAVWLAWLACCAMGTVFLVMVGVVIVLAALSARVSHLICAKLSVVNEGLSLISDGRYDEIGVRAAERRALLDHNATFVTCSSARRSNKVSPKPQAEAEYVVRSGDIRELEESIRHVQVVAHSLKQKTDELAATQAGYRKFVPEEMVRLLWVADILAVKPGDSTESVLTTMFVDIRDFTTISQSFERGDVMRLLNAFAHEVVPICAAHGGAIDQYLGDAVVAVFREWPDALLAAAAIAGSVQSVEIAGHTTGTHLQRRIQLKAGVGLCTGPITVGIIGTPDRMELTAIGDAVNEASRIEGLTKYFGANVLFTVTPELDAACHFSPDFNDWGLFPHLKQLHQEEDLHARLLGFVCAKGNLAASPLYELLTGSHRMDSLKRKHSQQFKQRVVDPFAVREFEQCLGGVAELAALYRTDLRDALDADDCARDAYRSLEAVGNAEGSFFEAGHFRSMRVDPALVDCALLVYAARAVLFLKHGCDQEDLSVPLALQFD
eukprot:TRINITY_DN4392_c0_g1_i1.p1 TRINITY_DN4392_c0_g1~~TRINITY_DN4392_c0_g1_i1.p1  ORF type:complete len:904 (+),score=236.28 TRINITY_DN4392_c0_g1_i1:58-2769(+)